MSFIIGSKCVDICDTGCIAACPVDCIHGPIYTNKLGEEVKKLRKNNDLKGKQLFINPSECIECGACLSECPPNAIFEYEQDAIKAGEKKYVHKNYNFFNINVPEEFK